MCVSSQMRRYSFFLAVVALLAGSSFSHAGELAFSAPSGLMTWFDWGRDPADLPPRFRTNCAIHNGRFYCAYRCGTTYQFYYCSPASFGCCHIGDGYCDYRGFLRCRP